MFSAIWDTGATNTVITENVAKQCGLVPTGLTQVHSVHGSKLANTYLVNVYLPNHVEVQGLRVTEGDLLEFDLLIGMDIISTGDFAVTNFRGKTMFSFRVPSQAHIDFVADHVPMVKKPAFTTRRDKNPQKHRK